MSTIKRDLTIGVFYIAIAKYSGIVIQLVITSILARLLSPSDFGLVAIATVFIFFFNLIADIGVGPAIVQRKDLIKNDLNNLFSLSIGIGVLLSVGFFFLSTLIARYYGQIELNLVCKWLCLLVLFNSMNVVPNSILLRNKEFRFIAIRTLIVQFISGTTAVVIAYLGCGFYSLIFQPILASVLLFLINYYNHPLAIRFIGYKSTLSKVASFSIYQFLFNFVNYFSRNLDKLLIGKYMGVVPLGYYEKSYRMMMLPLQNITFVITPVMHPVFSSLQDNYRELVEKYMKVLHLLAYISIPLSVWLFFSAKELILIVFGSQWLESILPFKILALSVFIQVLNSTTGAIFQSSNNTKGLFLSGICGALFLLGSFFLTIFVWRTLFAISIGFNIALVLAAYCSFYILFKRLNFSMLAFVKMLMWPFIGGVFLFCLLFLFESLFLISNILLSLSMKTVLCFVFTFILMQLCGKYDIIGFIRGKLNFTKH